MVFIHEYIKTPCKCIYLHNILRNRDLVLGEEIYGRKKKKAQIWIFRKMACSLNCQPSAACWMLSHNVLVELQSQYVFHVSAVSQVIISFYIKIRSYFKILDEYWTQCRVKVIRGYQQTHSCRHSRDDLGIILFLV